MSCFLLGKNLSVFEKILKNVKSKVRELGGFEHFGIEKYKCLICVFGNFIWQKWER